MANNQSVRRHLDAFTRGRIIGKLEEGRSVTSVAAEFGIAHSIVSRLWRQFQTTGTAIRATLFLEQGLSLIKIKKILYPPKKYFLSTFSSLIEPRVPARLAQSVEHETLNLGVVGSSPTLGG
ncbi:hypothetical protein TNCV_324391 [Trichonephila clavipes]|nr:hypothetical protein TNCV_324391 [Trichonephila clavipes]